MAIDNKYLDDVTTEELMMLAHMFDVHARDNRDPVRYQFYLENLLEDHSTLSPFIILSHYVSTLGGIFTIEKDYILDILNCPLEEVPLHINCGLQPTPLLKGRGRSVLIKAPFFVKWRLSIGK